MSARTRRYALLWHRYAGLFMAGFLALAGLTGSILAFRDQIVRWLSPRLYATVQPGVHPLDLQTLAQRAQGLVPHARVSGVSRLDADQVQVMYTAEKDPATGVGLWLWPIIFVFAWSSVMFNLRFPVYDYVMRSVFDYESQIQVILELAKRGEMNKDAQMPLDMD
ncbi:MAG: PepSY domain-containing protein [Vicinamibacterales bacterium]